MSKWKEGIKKGFLDNSTEVWASLMAQTITDLPAMQETWVLSLGQDDPPGKGMDTPLQYFYLENSMDRGARWVIVHGVAKSQTPLSDQHFHFFFAQK